MHNHNLKSASNSLPHIQSYLPHLNANLTRPPTQYDLTSFQPRPHTRPLRPLLVDLCYPVLITSILNLLKLTALPILLPILPLYSHPSLKKLNVVSQLNSRYKVCNLNSSAPNQKIILYTGNNLCQCQDEARTRRS